MEKKKLYFDVMLKNEDLVIFYNHFAEILIQYKVGDRGLEDVIKHLSALLEICEKYYPHMNMLDRNRKEGFSQLVYKSILNLELFFERNELKSSVRDVLKHNHITQNRLSELLNSFHKNHKVEYVADIKQPHISLILSMVDIQEQQPELHWSVYFNLMKFLTALKDYNPGGSISGLVEKEMVIIEKGEFKNIQQIEVCGSFIEKFMKIRNNIEDKQLKIMRNRMISPLRTETGRIAKRRQNDPVTIAQWVEKQITIKSVTNSTLNL